MKRLLGISLAVVLALSLSIVALPAQPVSAGGVFNVPSGYSTIQAGINAAFTASGGTVLVAAGTYNENITLKSGVDVISDRTGDTIISGSSGLPVVLANGVTDAKLDGFTITNGSGTQSGAGIAIQASSSNVTISNCVITGNTALLSGGGITISNSSANIINCTITGNTANKIGVWGGTGGGIYISNSSATITNSISANNTALNDGGGIYVSSGSSPTINYNNVWGNSPNNYSVGYSPGSNDISTDPLFVNPGGGDYHQQSGSSCIDAGDNSAPNLPDTDKDGNARIINGTVDMGAYEYQPTNSPPIIKTQAISELESLLPTGEKKVDKKIEKTIEHLEKALDEALWLDDTHLDEKHGAKVFNEEEKTVNELKHLLDKDDTPEDVKDVCQSVINKLIEVDELLATTAYEEAQSGTGSPKVDKELEKCDKEFEKAEEELAKGEYDKTIKHYKNAWKHAQKALGKAPEDDE